jgi:hypothetical protein
MRDTRRYSGKRYGEGGRYASKQEMAISENYPSLQYQPPIRIAYSQDYHYLPDWRLGIDRETGLAVYIEGKEVFTQDMCAKYEAVVNCNSRLMLLIVTPRIPRRDLDRLSAHPRIEVILSRNTIPEEWFMRTRETQEDE